jgi:membrane fusion protein, multidrug efflux system
MQKTKLSGRIIGGALLAASIAAVFILKPKTRIEPEDPTPRPIKSMVVGAGFQHPILYFPGIVSADAKVSLSFNVPGQIIFKPHNKGDAVKEGDILARLDDTSFKNAVSDAQAEVTRAEATMNRMAKALESNAVSREEFSKAKSDYDKAVAQLGIRQKDLADTVIRARFDGIIADSFVDTFDTLGAGQAVLTLQNNTLVSINVAIPEQYVIRKRSEEDKLFEFYAVFDALPGERFPVRIKEYTSSADARTQTYSVSFQMEQQEKFNFLSGMSATVVVENFHKKVTADPQSIAIESDCLGIDSDGSHFVWILEKSDSENIYSTVRRTVKTGERSGTTIRITEGLKEGERIAAAGISVLTEGRLVKLLEPAADKEI